MILIFHGSSHVGVVSDLSQWSVYTCKRTACNCCRKEEIPVEIVTMRRLSQLPSAWTSLAAPRDLPHQVFRLRQAL